MQYVRTYVHTYVSNMLDKHMYMLRKVHMHTVWIFVSSRPLCSPCLSIYDAFAYQFLDNV